MITILIILSFCTVPNSSSKPNMSQLTALSSIRRKKKPVVPVSYREKIRVGRSEIKFLFEYFFSWLWRFFAARFAVESRHQY